MKYILLVLLTVSVSAEAGFLDKVKGGFIEKQAIEKTEKEPVVTEDYINELRIKAFDDENSLNKLKELAEQGNSEAQIWLSDMYLDGIGTSKDYDKAYSWAKESAKQGNAAAQSILGQFYFYGLGNITQNIDEAYKWFKLSAEQGDLIAGSKIDSYKKGFYSSKMNKKNLCQEIKKNKYNLKTSDLAIRIYYQGRYYMTGENVLPNEKYAQECFEISAGLCYGGAMLIIGNAYGKGDPSFGYNQDYIKAYLYINLAIKNNEGKAYYYLQELKEKMTPSQIEEAEKLAKEWKPKTWKLDCQHTFE